MRGRRLNGRYELVELIGSGGMGEVWRARDTELDRDVAVKVLIPRRGAPEDTGHDELLGRFQREARAAAALDSPHIVAVHDHGTDGDAPFLVMALVEGRTLHEELLATGRVPLREALGWTADVCRALATAHRAGVVHRDIKPANIMVTREGTAKVVDFGIAKFTESRATDPQLTQTGAMPFGSVLYMAPEQFRQEDLDGRTDLYALGCVLYELLVGRPPYTGTAAGVMYNHLHDTPLRPSRARTELTPAHDRFVLALMARDPDDRPADADTALTHVQNLLDGTPTPPPQPQPQPQPQPDPELDPEPEEPDPEPEPERTPVREPFTGPGFRRPHPQPSPPSAHPRHAPSNTEALRATAGHSSHRAQVVLASALSLFVVGGLVVAKLGDGTPTGTPPPPTPASASPSATYEPGTYTLAVAQPADEETNRTEVSGAQRARVVRAALKQATRGKGKLPVRVVPVDSDSPASLPGNTLAVVGAVGELDDDVAGTGATRRIPALDTCSGSGSHYQVGTLSPVADARELGKQEGRYLQEKKGVRTLLVGAEDETHRDIGIGTTPGLKASGISHPLPVDNPGELKADDVADALRQHNAQAASLPLEPGPWTAALKKERRLAVVEATHLEMCAPAEVRLRHEEKFRDLPDGSLRFRPFRDEAQKPDCALTPRLCEAPADVEPLLHHRGAAELYDATLVLAESLPSVLKGAPGVDTARGELRAATARSTTQGLLGTYTFHSDQAGTRARERPVWVDERRDGKWKELGTVQQLLDGDKEPGA